VCDFKEQDGFFFSIVKTPFRTLRQWTPGNKIKQSREKLQVILFDSFQLPLTGFYWTCFFPLDKGGQFSCLS